jgi:hypothetical protein
MPIEIAYTPNDFYYVTSGIYDNVKKNCKNYLSDKTYWDDKCCVNVNDKNQCNNNWNDISNNCYEYELCKNKQYADLAKTLQNNNGGAIERHSNLQKQYNNEILKTVNISTSILLITYLSVYFFK